MARVGTLERSGVRRVTLEKDLSHPWDFDLDLVRMEIALWLTDPSVFRNAMRSKEKAGRWQANSCSGAGAGAGDDDDDYVVRRISRCNGGPPSYSVGFCRPFSVCLCL